MMRKTILIADNDAKALEKARKALEGKSFRVETAGNGLECLQKLHQGLKPALLISETSMPVMSGWRAAFEIGKDKSLAKIKIVLYSHHEKKSLPKHKEYCKELHLHYIVKPFTPAELVKKVKALTGG